LIPRLENRLVVVFYEFDPAIFLWSLAMSCGSQKWIHVS